MQSIAVKEGDHGLENGFMLVEIEVVRGDEVNGLGHHAISHCLLCKRYR